MNDPVEKTLHTHSSVAEFFHEVVSEALRQQGVSASAHAEFYLVNLLAEFSHGALMDQPLALLLAEAQEAEPGRRLQALRTIGDHALYVCGFFADSLERKLVDCDYYIAIGGAAYRHLANHKSTGQGEVFGELSGKFPRFVDVLAEVSEKTRLSSNAGLLRLYERYLRTGSSRAERQLRRLGLGVVPSTSPAAGTAPEDPPQSPLSHRRKGRASA